MQFNGRWLFSPRSTAFPSASAKSSRSKGKVSVEVQHIVQTRKSKFIAAILIYIFMCLYYDILDLATLLEPGQGKNPAIQTTFIRRLLFPSTSPEIPITTRELLSRSWHTIGTFIIEPLILTSIHHIFAILSISLGLDSAADWPQFFGDITECYTVRNFWGKFWHRMIYRCTTCYTVLICDVIFGGHEKDGVPSLYKLSPSTSTTSSSTSSAPSAPHVLVSPARPFTPFTGLDTALFLCFSARRIASAAIILFAPRRVLEPGIEGDETGVFRMRHAELSVERRLWSFV
ncbi:hypothetical protein G7Y89_g7038 [Cudoniella acicularis]|uniref:Wax synthase domain-containing protein n=1 Tax=Cudoniella acicularis TaxID=354080 RepID=A0A8H4W473_9HELO|nr:hypothetical protein G7Y89_g7038 [Cudoniella acicularis]